MGEPIPGQGDNEQYVSPEGKLDLFVVANGVQLRVYWQVEEQAYVFEFKFMNTPKEEVEKAGIDNNEISFTSDEATAKQAFKDITSLAVSYGEDDIRGFYESLVRVLKR